MTDQKPLFLESSTKYLVLYKNKLHEAWYYSSEHINDAFVFKNYRVIPSSDVEVLERIGTQEEVFG